MRESFVIWGLTGLAVGLVYNYLYFDSPTLFAGEVAGVGVETVAVLLTSIATAIAVVAAGLASRNDEEVS